MNENKVKFVVAGGGTAGWIAALYLKKYFPENSITVIESSEIGILGAGEGTTPHFTTFLKQVGINENEFIKKTKATFKTGIKFTNWHGDNEYYYHPFLDSNFGNSQDFNDDMYLFSVGHIANGKSLNDICLSNFCSEQNKLKYYYEDGFFKCIGFYAYHFDARLTAQYLKEVAINRGVFHIDSKIISSTHNEDDLNVTGLVLENNQKVDCDFLFDCTGFSRKIIGGIFKEEWIDYKKSLPADKALPFFIENKTSVVPPYTEAIAMKHGWIWKIPVQGRYGCGYVFDSSYASDEEIKNEIVEMFGEVEIPRSFSFKAGFYKNIWVKNCISLGLASGFIEPLEATSIWTTIKSLSLLFEEFPKTIFTKNKEEIELYNKSMREFNGRVKDFIQLHYLTKRNDSSFWKEYTTKNLISDRLMNYNKIKSVDEYMEMCGEEFKLFNPFWVFNGVKICNNEIFKKDFEEIVKNPKHFNYKERLDKYKRDIIRFANFQAVDHHKFLEHIKNI